MQSDSELRYAQSALAFKSGSNGAINGDVMTDGTAWKDVIGASDMVAETCASDIPTPSYMAKS